MSITTPIPTPILAAIPPFAAFTWALRGHFRTDLAMPPGMRLLGATSLAAFTSFVVLSTSRGAAPTLAGLACFLASLLLFLWTVRTTRKQPPRLAHSAAAPDSLHLGGPFRLVRHPFYLSYMLFWIGTALSAGRLQAPFAALLLGWYALIARAEENLIARSPLAETYSRYKRKTGMLLPRLRTQQSA